MTGWWLVSYYLLWGITIAVLVVLLVVLRQLGLIYLRGQGGGVRLGEGPEIGTLMNPFSELDDETGTPVRFPDGQADLGLLLLTSPDCAICKETLRGLRAVARRSSIQVLVLSEGEIQSNAELRRLVRDAEARFVTNLQRQRLLGVITIPYGIVVDGKTGLVLDKGIVNNLHDVEELVERASDKANRQAIFSTDEVLTLGGDEVGKARQKPHEGGDS